MNLKGKGRTKWGKVTTVENCTCSKFGNKTIEEWRISTASAPLWEPMEKSGGNFLGSFCKYLDKRDFRSVPKHTEEPLKQFDTSEGKDAEAVNS